MERRLGGARRGGRWGGRLDGVAVRAELGAVGRGPRGVRGGLQLEDDVCRRVRHFEPSPVDGGARPRGQRGLGRPPGGLHHADAGRRRGGQRRGGRRRGGGRRLPLEAQPLSVVRSPLLLRAVPLVPASPRVLGLQSLLSLDFLRSCSGLVVRTEPIRVMGTDTVVATVPTVTIVVTWN